MSFKLSAPLATDGYKTGHKFQYADGTEFVYSNFTPRSSKWAPILKDNFENKVVNFGIQYYIKDYLIDSWNETFFGIPKDIAVEQYRRRMDTYLGKGVVPPDHIAELWDLGYLPLSIKALPEGELVDLRVPLFTVKNTHPKFFWVTNYIETTLSSDTWKLITNATLAYEYRKVGEFWGKKTGCRSFLQKVLMHDFSARGMSGRMDAAISGMAHLINFVGTDTLGAIEALEYFYNANADKELVGCSIPATEHAVACFSGESGEFELFKHLITNVYPKGMVSLVADGFDYYRVLTEYIPRLKDVIQNRQADENGLNKTVLRPDSGDNVRVVAGYLESELEETENGNFVVTATGEEITPAEALGTIQILWDIFGGSVNEAGYKVLAPCIGCISGEGWNLEKLNAVFSLLEKKGFASTNLATGMGSFGYTHCTRDSYGMAMKATWGQVNGVGRDIFKNPKTDGAFTKKSAKGLLRVERENGKYVLYDSQTIEQEQMGELKEIFRDGKLLVDVSLSEIRARIDRNVEDWLSNK